jgi:hypothetical protein
MASISQTFNLSPLPPDPGGSRSRAYRYGCASCDAVQIRYAKKNPAPRCPNGHGRTALIPRR